MEGLLYGEDDRALEQDAERGGRISSGAIQDLPTLPTLGVCFSRVVGLSDFKRPLSTPMILCFGIQTYFAIFFYYFFFKSTSFH